MSSLFDNCVINNYKPNEEDCLKLIENNEHIELYELIYGGFIVPKNFTKEFQLKLFEFDPTYIDKIDDNILTEEKCIESILRYDPNGGYTINIFKKIPQHKLTQNICECALRISSYHYI